MDQYIGRLLDNRYEILEIIGTGGMAVVYKARCHRLNRLVAIKILKDEFARDEEFRRRFHAEGEAVAMLSHPNIVQVYDVSTSDKANFIVMELIDGISLKQYMEKKGVLNWKETLHFAMQIGKGLEHAHSRGIVHRDIKPHNVMVLKNGSVKVMDFGIARVMSKSNTLTKEALGSVHYISPEQAKGGYTDNRSDLYSLSVVMYEMMAGRPPYDGESPVAVAIQHINGGAAMPSTLNPNIPGGLEQIIMKGMALEVADRYASATQMLQDMEEFRKNPTILFDYRSVLDDDTRPIAVIPGIKAKTTAEKVVQAKTGMAPTDSGRIRDMSGSSANMVRRTTGSTGNSLRNREAAEAARRAQIRKKAEEIQRAEEERSRVATIAIVICSIVAIFAIGVFLVALFNGALLNKQVEYVHVPYLVGEMYTENLEREYKDVKIELMPYEYDTTGTYMKGQIMYQQPAGGEKVAKDTMVKITVSMGEEPEVKIMDNWVGFPKDEVKSALEGQGFKPVFCDEPSDFYDEGKIIRTDPAKGSELKEGQTIKIWVSSGPKTVTAKMPNVVGYDEEVARSVLNQMGFEKLRTRPVDSEMPKGQVVYQSEEKDTVVDVTKEIFLEISKGPAETTAPTENTPPVVELPKPTETQPEAVSKTVHFALPQLEEPYLLSIRHSGTSVIEGVTIQPGVDQYAANLLGIGTITYDVFINGEYYSSQVVEFSNG